MSVMSAPGVFGNDGSNTRASQFEPSQNFQNKALTIFVPSGIHAEASAPLPFFVELDPPQLVPPDSVLQIRRLPPGASLSEGHRVSADGWVVPIAELSNLEVRVTLGDSQRSILTLTLIRADGGLLANAHTVLTILEPIGWSATVAADKETKTEAARKAAEAKKAEEERVAAGAAKKAEEARRLAEAKAAEDARRAEAARKAAEAKKAEEERVAAEAAKEAEEARRLAEAKAAEDARRAEAARKAAEAKKAEEERVAAEAAKKAEEARRLAEAKAAEDARRAEAAHKAAEAKKAEEERVAAEAAKEAEEARRLAEAKAAEDARRAEAARKAADMTTAQAVASSKAEERGAQISGKEVERSVPRPSPGSQNLPDVSVSPEPKLAGISARPNAAPEVTASAAPLSADRERLAKMIARGEHELEEGNVSTARQFFLRAAEGGLARGALLLAWTYDKHEFARLRILGVTPNRELADKWYQRARELEAADKTGAR